MFPGHLNTKEDTKRCVTQYMTLNSEECTVELRRHNGYFVFPWGMRSKSSLMPTLHYKAITQIMGYYPESTNEETEAK